MAPDLVKYGDKYYIYFPAQKTNWVTWAYDIKGPWSEPVDLKVDGIDPGHITDEQGNRYLHTDNGWVIRLADDGLSTIGEKQKVYDGWLYPDNWDTECMCLESPKLAYHDGWYYMTTAEGGTAGPATSHMVVSARSKSPVGPWENSPYNPIVHTYSATDPWWSKGHGTLVEGPGGQWWVVYHAYAKGLQTLGRHTLMEPIEWTSDGWWRTTEAPATPVRLPLGSNENGMALSDDFNSERLGLQWAMWKGYSSDAITVGKGVMSIKGKGTSPADGRLTLITAEHHNYVVEVTVRPSKGNAAGLLLFYNEKAYAGVTTDGHTVTLYTDAAHTQTIVNKWGKNPRIRLHNRAGKVDISISNGDDDRYIIARDLDVTGFHHNNFHGFFALRPALVACGEGEAHFSHFTYTDAVPKEQDMEAYLMVYHKDEDHGLHMALSRDGYTFRALNNGDPVMAGDTISWQRGIRDPHIYRGPDGAFYVSMTDLHVYAHRDGYSLSPWERPVEEYGWGNNHAMVLLKSWDLINWQRTNVCIDRLSAAFSEVGCVWAPEVTYDEEEQRLMLYFTMRFKKEPAALYYCYVNDDFTTLETMPRLLFEYPDGKSDVIDGDIIRKDGKYYLHYVVNDGGGGVKVAVGDHAVGPYRYDPRWVDCEAVDCEAPNVWKRIGEEKYVLTYDIFRLKPNNFGFAETSDFISYTDLGRFGEGVMKAEGFSSPKHGAVVQITREEADRIEMWWKEHPKPYIRQASVRHNPVICGTFADPYIIFSKKFQRYYLYPTTDGQRGWTSLSFSAFSSDNLHSWRNEGEILNLNQVDWAQQKAWAPTVIEKQLPDGTDRYFLYYTAEGQIGCAEGTDPAGPFTDSGRPVIGKERPEGAQRGANIDPDVFHDPVSGKDYLYWGNGFLAVAELSADMRTVKPGTTSLLISTPDYYSEAPHVFYRDGWYYFTWSKNDTRSPDYEVRYVRSRNPLAPLDASKSTVILSKDADKGIYATGHHSVVEAPDGSGWYIAYHRFAFPWAVTLGRDAGYNREVCIDKLRFDSEGNILKVDTSL